MPLYESCVEDFAPLLRHRVFSCPLSILVINCISATCMPHHIISHIVHLHHQNYFYKKYHCHRKFYLRLRNQATRLIRSAAQYCLLLLRNMHNLSGLLRNLIDKDGSTVFTVLVCAWQMKHNLQSIHIHGGWGGGLHLYFYINLTGNQSARTNITYFIVFCIDF